MKEGRKKGKRKESVAEEITAVGRISDSQDPHKS